MCVCVGVGCVQRRTDPRGTAQTRLSQPARCLLARCRAGAAAAGVARARAHLQGHAPLRVAQAPGAGVEAAAGAHAVDGASSDAQGRAQTLQLQ